jgi:2-oxo-4-hydroxy-4-carboxy-5-ureidoimidazoline decarboxylase
MMMLADINQLSADAFVVKFGDVAEHSPWVAKAAAKARPYTSREEMIKAFETATWLASDDDQRMLLRAHPDLATRAKLTDDSNREQQGAGLDTLSPDEFEVFTKLNGAYKSRFGFPFIFAVKGASKHEILKSFRQRVHHSKAEEFEMALTQVCRIFRFRIEGRVSP